MCYIPVRCTAFFPSTCQNGATHHHIYRMNPSYENTRCSAPKYEHQSTILKSNIKICRIKTKIPHPHCPPIYQMLNRGSFFYASNRLREKLLYINKINRLIAEWKNHAKETPKYLHTTRKGISLHRFLKHASNKVKKLNSIWQTKA